MFVVLVICQNQISVEGDAIVAIGPRQIGKPNLQTVHIEIV